MTDRQRQSLRLIYQRYQIKEIASQLGISPDAVKQHLASARERLGGLPTSMSAARALAEYEGLATSPSQGSPESEVFTDDALKLEPVVSVASETAVLDDSQANVAYVAEHIPFRLPLPTLAKPTNDLTWRGKLLWGLSIAFVAVALIGAFKVLLD